MPKIFYFLSVTCALFVTSCVDYSQKGLYKAILKDDVKSVEKITTKLNIDSCQAPQKLNPFFFAIYNESYKSALFLVSQMHDFSFRDENGNNALFYSLNFGKQARYDLVKALLVKGVKVNQFHAREDYSALGFAAMKGDTALMRLFLNHGADVNLKKNEYALSPLYLAVACGKTSAVSFLITNGANLYTGSAYGNSVMEIAVATGRLSIFKYLIEEQKMYVDKHILDAIVNCNRLKMADYLITNNLISNKKWAEEMFQVSNPDLCRLILHSGVDVDYLNKHLGITALHYACINGDTEMIKFLLAHGANVNVLSKDKLYTPLMYASVYYNADLYLSDIDPDNIISIKIKLGVSETKTAQKSLTSVKELVNAGAKILYKNQKNETALKLALKCDNAPVADYFAEHLGSSRR